MLHQKLIAREQPGIIPPVVPPLLASLLHIFLTEALLLVTPIFAVEKIVVAQFQRSELFD